MAIIGIDLGTTNSLAACWRNGKAELIPNRLGSYLTPSVVNVSKDGNVTVGQIAKERLVTDPEGTAANFKRYMGSKKEFLLRGRSFRAEELSAFVLKQLIQDAERYLGEKVEEAVISVPAYFNEFSRSAVKNAGKIAGLKVDRILNEPSAAALASQNDGAMGTQEDTRVMVVDFGGGTLDVSMVEMFDNIVEIHSIAGDNHLGGHDFDTVIQSWFIQDVGLEESRLSDIAKGSILRAAEECKQQLSQSSSGEADMSVNIGEKEYHAVLTEDILTKISSDILRRFREVITKAVADSGFSFRQDDPDSYINEIRLVGGSSKMPLVRKFMAYLTRREPDVNTNPDEAIAIGIGMAVGIMERAGGIKDMLLTDICPFSLGMDIQDRETNKKEVAVIIERNAVLPCSARKIFSTLEPGQNFVRICVRQGESIKPEENFLVGEFSVPVPYNEKESETFEVTFSYDISGILNVTVNMISDGKSYNRVMVQNGLELSEAEINASIENLKKLEGENNNGPQEELQAWAQRLYQERIGQERAMVKKILEELYILDRSHGEIEYQRALRKLYVQLTFLDRNAKGVLPADWSEDETDDTDEKDEW